MLIYLVYQHDQILVLIVWRYLWVMGNLKELTQKLCSDFVTRKIKPLLQWLVCACPQLALSQWAELYPLCGHADRGQWGERRILKKNLLLNISYQLNTLTGKFNTFWKAKGHWPRSKPQHDQTWAFLEPYFNELLRVKDTFGSSENFKTQRATDKITAWPNWLSRIYGKDIYLQTIKCVKYVNIINCITWL